MVKGMSGPWRRRKYELRRAYYDPYDTYEERILHIPPNVKEEEWIEFCKNESSEKAELSTRGKDNYMITLTPPVVNLILW